MVVRYFIIALIWLSSPVLAQPIIAEDVEEEPLTGQTQPVIEEKTYRSIKLRGLDKITTRTEEIEAIMGAVTRFGNLEIIPRACWVAPPNKRPENAALMEVWYWKQGEKPSLVFYGWMFSSSPALSSLEHPVYDLTMLECLEYEEEKPETISEAEEPVEEKSLMDDDEGVKVLN